MKKFVLVSVLLFSMSSFLLAQQESMESSTAVYDDSTYVDTLNRNLIGLNVFPALGMFGNGRMPASKIAVQYKHMYDNMNIRASLNFISYFRDNDNVDIFGLTSTQVIADGDTTMVDSLILRQFYNNLYTYDFRFGAEVAFPRKNYRFYLGGGLVAGYHFVGEYYYHHNVPFNGYPVHFVNFFPYVSNPLGFREIDYLKIGADLTIGVDINISPNCVVSVQYAPELVFYKSMNESIFDPDTYYVTEVRDEFVFVPDYIDVIVSIRF